MAENLHTSADHSASSTAISFKPFTSEHLAQLKILNSVIFPVKYHERVYQDALACGPVSVLAFDDNTLIGAIVCRLEAKVDGRAELYIISLGVLAPYRGQGIGVRIIHCSHGDKAKQGLFHTAAAGLRHARGSRLLGESLAFCQDDPAIRQAKLHVHVGNEDALLFYAKQGFSVQETIKGYYKRLEPPDAAVLVKVLHEEGQHPPLVQ